MPVKENIYSLDLLYNGIPMPFVIKTMEENDNSGKSSKDKMGHRPNT